MESVYAVIRRPAEAVLHNLVIRYQIDKAVGRLNTADQLIAALFGIVDPGNHYVLKSNLAARIVVISHNRFHQVIELISLGDGHNLVSDFIVRRMKRDGQIKLQALFSIAQNARDDACCGDGNMAGTYIETELTISGLDESQDLIIIIERLSRAHDDNLRNKLIFAMFF